MMPLNIWIYARFVSDDPKFSPESIPYLRLVFTLVLIAIPVIIGMLLISKAPKWTKKVVRFAKPAALVFMLTFIALGKLLHRLIYELTFNWFTHNDAIDNSWPLKIAYCEIFELDELTSALPSSRFHMLHSCIHANCLRHYRIFRQRASKNL